MNNNNCSVNNHAYSMHVGKTSNNETRGLPKSWYA